MDRNKNSCCDEYVICSNKGCTNSILIHSYKYHTDECYEIEPGEIICGECILDYIKKYKK